MTIACSRIINDIARRVYAANRCALTLAVLLLQGGFRNKRVDIKKDWRRDK